MKKSIKIVFIFIVIGIIVTVLFNIRIINIAIEGNTKQSDEELISKIFPNDYDKISIVCYIKNNIKKHKPIIHIEKYILNWETPFSINIKIYEKEDIGYIKNDLQNVFFDKDGVISEISNVKKYNIPEVRGLNCNNFIKGTRLDIENKLIFDAVLNISSKLKEQNLLLNLVEISKDLKISVYIDNIKVELDDIKNMEVKLQRLIDIYPQIKNLSGILDLSNASENMLDEKYIFKKTA